MEYFVFLAMATLVVFLSIKLGKYVDFLDKTTKVSGAFIGGVLLAAVTSLPELFTSLSSTLFLKENGLVLGNILGSNLFNLAVFGAALLIMFPAFKKAKIGKNHMITVIACLGVYALITVAMFLIQMPKMGWINLVSPLILIIYVLVIVKTPKTEEGGEEFVCNLTLKQIITRFVICAVVLVGASVAITFCTDIISDKLNLGKTFAGALLLGLTTSLPELVSTFSLCKRGNFNAASGNIVGSNMFNFLILVISDVLSFQKGTDSVYIPFNTTGGAGLQSMLLLFLGIISSLLLLGIFFIKNRAEPKNKLLSPVGSISFGALTIVSYMLFLILSVVLL